MDYERRDHARLGIVRGREFTGADKVGQDMHLCLPVSWWPSCILSCASVILSLLRATTVLHKLSTLCHGHGELLSIEDCMLLRIPPTERGT